MVINNGILRLGLKEAKERAQRAEVYLQEFIPGLMAKNCHVNSDEREKVDNALRALNKKYLVKENATSLVPRATGRNLPSTGDAFGVGNMVMAAYQQQM